MLLRGLLDASHNLPLLHGSQRIQALLSILGVGSCGCLGSYNSGMIYLVCQRIFRRNRRDRKPADWEAFLTAAIPDMPHENMSSKTKEVLTLTSVRLEHFLLNQKLLFSFLHISHLTQKRTRPQRPCNTTAT